MNRKGLKDQLVFLFLLYLRELARFQLAKIRPVVIGITGSAGKTSLKRAAAVILSAKYRVKQSQKANSESGIPLNILGMQPRDYSIVDWLRLGLLAPLQLITNQERYDYYIAELGIDRPDPPKNMEYLLTIVRPTTAVFLNALPVHTEYFETSVSANIKNLRRRRDLLTDAIAQEKGKLIRSLPSQGTAILNFDDPRVRAFAKQTQARVVSFATQGNADFLARSVRVDLSGFSMEVVEGQQTGRLRLPMLLDEHYAPTLLGAISLGRACGISLADCLRSLKRGFRLPPGRMTVLPGIRGSTILDSSYNASGETMRSALRLLKRVAPGRKIAVLGDMRELGVVAAFEHRQVATLAAQCADVVVCVGPLMERWAKPQLLRLGFPKERLPSTQNTFAAGRLVVDLVQAGDTILVKGSQNTLFLEIVIEKLLRNAQDRSKLCRRGKFWEMKRDQLRRRWNEEV